MSKVGVHIIIGPRTGYGAFLKAIADAGQTLAVVKCVDDMSPACEAKQYNRNTLTVGRFNAVTDPVTGISYDLQAFKPSDYKSARDAAKQYWSLVLPSWVEHSDYIDVWETFNEMSSDWAWQGDFYIAMMDLADQLDLKLSHYNFSTGNPPEESWPELVPSLREAKRRGHHLSSHEYGGVPSAGVTDWPETLRGTDPDFALRYRRLYAYLREHDADPKLILSEVGQSGGSTFIGTQAFIEDYDWYDARLMQDDYVAGCCAWTLGRWGNANFQDALPALADYIIAHPGPGVALEHQTYLPIVARPGEEAPLGWLAGFSALALGAGAWLLGRRMRKRKH